MVGAYELSKLSGAFRTVRKRRRETRLARALTKVIDIELMGYFIVAM